MAQPAAASVSASMPPCTPDVSHLPTLEQQKLRLQVPPHLRQRLLHVPRTQTLTPAARTGDVHARSYSLRLPLPPTSDAAPSRCASLFRQRLTQPPPPPSSANV